VPSSSRVMTRPARGVVVALIERLGFAAVDLGAIAEGGRAQQFRRRCGRQGIRSTRVIGIVGALRARSNGNFQNKR